MASRCWVPVASGPLARYAAGYGAWLAARGYSRWTIAHRLWQLELLSRWLECEGFSSERADASSGSGVLGGAESGWLLLVGVGAEHDAAAGVPALVGGGAVVGSDGGRSA